MRLESVIFEFGNERYRRLAAVLAKSAAKNSPATPLTIHEITEADADVLEMARPDCHRLFIYNARKAKHHAAIIEGAKDGEVIGMLDVDLMILADLSEIESLEFDLAYTVRPNPEQHPLFPWKINTGAYFVRVSDDLKLFVRKWHWTVRKMLQDKEFHEYWCNKQLFGGIHQAALGCILSENNHIDVLQLPCEVWNSCNGTWTVSDNPKIVHIMAGLRDWCIYNTPRSDPYEQRLVTQWQEFSK